MRVVLALVTCFALMATAAEAGIGTAEVELTATREAGRPSLRFAVVDPAPEPVRLEGLIIRPIAGARLATPQQGRRVGLLRFTDPTGVAREVVLRRLRTQRGQVGRYVLADSLGAQVVLREDGPTRLTVSAPDRSTNVEVSFTAGPDGLVRIARCRELHPTVRVYPLRAGQRRDFVPPHQRR